MNEDINFNTNERDTKRIEQIAKRAGLINAWGKRGLDVLDLEMSLAACHMNGTPLDLQGLLGAKPMDFTHDIIGILQHIDRSTGEMGGLFSPRFASKQS